MLASFLLAALAMVNVIQMILTGSMLAQPGLVVTTVRPMLVSAVTLLPLVTDGITILKLRNKWRFNTSAFLLALTWRIATFGR
jgi:hypothetical protein